MPEVDGDEPEEPQQLVLMRRVVELSVEQTRQSTLRTEQSAQRSEMSAERSEMSAERSYMNAERTLSVWTRTALASMIAGIAVDRFGLTLTQHHPFGIGPDRVSTGVGAALVGFGALIAVVTGARFWRYAADYRRRHIPPEHHGPYMAPAFALITSVFGIVLFVLLLVTL